MEDPPEPLESFPKFTSLPPELRQEIWSYCLPHRAVQMHDSRLISQLRRQKEEGGRKCPILPNLPKPPSISRVCREAQSFALLHGGLEAMFGTRTPVWFDRKRDVLHIDRIFPGGALPVDVPATYMDIQPGLQTLVCNPDVPLSIDVGLITRDYGRYYENLMPPADIVDGRSACDLNRGLSHWTLKRLVERKTCSVVIRNMTICMSHHDALASGFFGLFAEDSTVHVNVEDTQRIKALSALCKEITAPSSRRERMRGYRWREYIETDIAYFLKCVKTIWLKQHDVLPSMFSPLRLGPEMEEGFEELLRRLPRFTYVVAVHLCTVKRVDEDGASRGDTDKEKQVEDGGEMGC
ncbi:hypothetical protein F5Y06DRAFT_296047 [Hypoxylon sp. FL0890]|nr:hypothetical protein F5Y06DRAFT_296047 [Hypoxylon sp. FL0890]